MCSLISATSPQLLRILRQTSLSWVARGTARIRAMTTFYHARHARKLTNANCEAKKASFVTGLRVTQWRTISQTSTRAPSSGRYRVRPTKPQRHYVARAGIFATTSFTYSARVGPRQATRLPPVKRVGCSQRRANPISTLTHAGYQGARVKISFGRTQTTKGIRGGIDHGDAIRKQSRVRLSVD